MANIQVSDETAILLQRLIDCPEDEKAAIADAMCATIDMLPIDNPEKAIHPVLARYNNLITALQQQ